MFFSNHIWQYAPEDLEAYKVCGFVVPIVQPLHGWKGWEKVLNLVGEMTDFFSKEEQIKLLATTAAASFCRMQWRKSYSEKRDWIWKEEISVKLLIKW